MNSSHSKLGALLIFWSLMLVGSAETSANASHSSEIAREHAELLQENTVLHASICRTFTEVSLGYQGEVRTSLLETKHQVCDFEFPEGNIAFEQMVQGLFGLSLDGRLSRSDRQKMLILGETAVDYLARRAAFQFNFEQKTQ